MSWFHGNISREEAEKLLVPREDGLFLVRESNNFPGDYTLCVSFEGEIQYYRVEIVQGRMTVDNIDFFDDLESLIEHYEQDADGLCTQLQKSVPRADSLQAFRQAGLIIDAKNIIFGETIGKGEFGDVLFATLKKGGRRVAVKTKKDPARAAQEFLTEASVMKSLTHKNLVQLIGIVVMPHSSPVSTLRPNTDPGSISLVFEYMSKGSLVDYLRSRGRQHITRMVQIDFACDICEGMKYLESKKVVHRDLAARNVLINESNVAKISDFGLAQLEFSKCDTNSSVSSKLPIKWTAPEALKNSKFSSKSDMWSFGVLLWEIYSYGRVPYPRIQLEDVVKQVTEADYRMSPPEGCPAEIARIMQISWSKNPDRRPTFTDTLKKLNGIRKLERSRTSSELREAL